jgi:hypothetical protein
VTAVGWTWLAIAAMGVAHGVNPAMGWLFAVSLGLQEGRSQAVWRALPPLALGHALAIATAALTAVAVGQVVPAHLLRWIVGVSLLAVGSVRLVRHSHPRYGGMRIGFRGLTIWSFLMASAHGAGLMVLPLLVGEVAGTAEAGGGGHAIHGLTAAHAALVPALAVTDVTLWATVFHTAGYLLVTGVIAVIVYRKLGLRLLRSMWFNLDLLWGGALLGSGALTLLL